MAPHSMPSMPSANRGALLFCHHMSRTSSTRIESYGMEDLNFARSWEVPVNSSPHTGEVESIQHLTSKGVKTNTNGYYFCICCRDYGICCPSWTRRTHIHGKEWKSFGCTMLQISVSWPEWLVAQLRCSRWSAKDLFLRSWSACAPIQNPNSSLIGKLAKLYTFTTVFACLCIVSNCSGRSHGKEMPPAATKPAMLSSTSLSTAAPYCSSWKWM